MQCLLFVWEKQNLHHTWEIRNTTMTWSNEACTNLNLNFKNGGRSRLPTIQHHNRWSKSHSKSFVDNREEFSDEHSHSWPHSDIAVNSWCDYSVASLLRAAFTANLRPSASGRARQRNVASRRSLDSHQAFDISTASPRLRSSFDVSFNFIPYFKQILKILDCWVDVSINIRYTLGTLNFLLIMSYLWFQLLYEHSW